MTNKVRWLVLPTKANRDMEQAGAAAAREYLERTGGNSLWAIYEAMVAAAPQPPASIEPVVVADERAAFERFCVDSFNRSCNPRIPMKMELMLAARRGEKYTSTGWSEMWKGWKARAALDLGGGTVLSQKGEAPVND